MQLRSFRGFRRNAVCRAPRRSRSSTCRNRIGPAARDAGRENGMGVFVGRLRECPVLDVKFVACGHNTIRGAAGAAVLNAELMASEGCSIRRP